MTTDGGQTWSTYATSADASAPWVTASSLPSVASHGPNGMYALNGISCVSAISCVAVGGLNEVDGTATVISTTNGGASWSLSPDPRLAGIQQLFGVSCIAQSPGLPFCEAAGTAGPEGPVTLMSSDGGTTWSGEEFLGGAGWLSSISCSDTADCWVAGAGTTLALAGTTNGGQSWQATYDDTTNQEGSVSCASAEFCVATTDGLYVTTDDGGLTPGSSAPVTLTQASPTSASVADGAGYSGQLTVTNGTGTVSYSETASTDSADVVVSSTGAITAAASLAPDTYTVGGTDADTNGDTGTWSFALTVRTGRRHASAPPPSSPPSPPLPPSGLAAAPGAPTDLSATAGNASATLTWTPPSSDGGAAITGYVIKPSKGSAVESATSRVTPSGAK